MTTFLAPATFDTVCHPLECPRCGQTARDACGIDLQTKLQAQPTMGCLRVGDRVQLRENLGEGGYLILRDVRDPLHVIEEWICDECGMNFLWALLEIHDGILVSVKPVELDGPTLETADLISGQVLFLFPTGESRQILTLDPSEIRVKIAAAEAERMAELGFG